MKFLPLELQLIIFDYCDLRTQFRFFRTNKYWFNKKKPHHYSVLIQDNCGSTYTIKHFDSLFGCIRYCDEVSDADDSCHISIRVNYSRRLYYLMSIRLHYDCPCVEYLLINEGPYNTILCRDDDKEGRFEWII